MVGLAAPARPAVLTFVQAHQGGAAGLEGLDAVGVAVSPDGLNAYVASEADDAVVVFSRSPDTGTLLYAERKEDGQGGVDGLREAGAVAVAPDGAHVYVAGAGDNAIAIFARHPATGVLTFLGLVRDGTGGVDGLAGVRALALSPDGANLYATGFGDRALAVFQRDAATGNLVFLEREVDGSGGVDGLALPTSVVVSPDGAHVYATGSGDDSVVLFARDPATGVLTFVERRRDGVAGVDGLAGAAALALSPDGVHLYVAGTDEDEVAVFARNPATGALTFLERQEDGVNGVRSLDRPLGVSVSPDGGYVYVAASSGRAVLVFIRNRTTGRLTFLDRARDGLLGVQGLVGVEGLAPSPDGAQLYAAARGSNAVTVFQVTLGITTTTTTLSSSTTSTTLPRCGSTPQAGCRRPVLPARGLFLLRDRKPSRRDVLVWKWRRGAATAAVDFGDPRSRTGYRLCVYEPRGSGTRLILDAKAPAGGRCADRKCWHGLADRRGFVYRDPDRSPDGLASMVLRAGPSGQAAITIVGRGSRLGVPRLPITPKVTVQLRAGNGECWEAEYSTPRRNAGTRFTARAD